MSKLTTRIAAAAADTTDAVVALLEAAWPRSTTAREIDRLSHDGYPTGAACDVFFLLSFETPDWERALGDLHAAGFVVRDASTTLGAFVTVRTHVRLRAFELSLAATRLDRVVAPYGGFATLIGPAAAARRPVPIDPETAARLADDASSSRAEQLSGAA